MSTPNSVLIVDDNPNNLQLLVDYLTNKNYEIFAAEDGESALELIEFVDPDLILLDVMMPGINGFETCRRLKAHPKTADIPVIFMTALSDTSDKLKGFEAGGVDYVTKPIQYEELIARANTHITIRSLQKTLTLRNQSLETEIAERERVEEQLRQHAAELEASNAELNSFDHTVAHNLKSPLTSLLAMSSLLQFQAGQLSPEKLSSYMDDIIRSTQRMDKIINELLLLASVRKLEEVQVETLDMDVVLGDVQARMGREFSIANAEINLPDEWLPALGYGPWVEEVWANYLSNAVKYGGQPPVLHLGNEALPNGQVKFWVSDNGPGLSAQAQEKLFTPFTRLHQLNIKGHGLGLSIVSRIIQKLHGEVGIESSPGQGSTFYFTLPETSPAEN